MKQMMIDNESLLIKGVKMDQILVFEFYITIGSRNYIALFFVT